MIELEILSHLAYFGNVISAFWEDVLAVSTSIQL